MGLRDLVLVEPRCEPRDEQARAMAAHGLAVLEAARVASGISAALNDCTRIYALTGKGGFYRDQAAITPRAAAVEALAPPTDARSAFLFGPEDHGLLTSELLHADRVITIPAAPEYPILNVAAAVLVMGYELHLVAGAPRVPNLQPGQGELADGRRKGILFDRLFDALDRVGFFFGQNPDHLKYALRHLLGRSDLSVNEVDILIGMARQIRWYVERHPRQ